MEGRRNINSQTPIIEIDYKPHEAQRIFHNNPARFRLFLGGVRSGKSLSGAAEGIKIACSRAGSKGWIVAPNFPMSNVARDYITKLIPEYLIKEYKASERKYTLWNENTIEIKSADSPDTMRGAGIDWCWIDEGAYMTEYAWQVIQTRLSDRQGICWITTTPKGKTSWIYDFKNLSIRHPDKFAVIHCKTSDNPYFPKDELTNMRERIPTNFYLQEYEAEFIDNSGQFRYEWFADCFDSELALGYPAQNTSMGIDLAISKVGDFFVIIVLGDYKGKTLIADIFKDKGLTPNAMKQVINTFASKYKPYTIMVENNAFQDYMVQELQQETHLPVRGFTTGKQKADPYLGIPSLAAVFENRRFVIPRKDEHSRRLTDELIDECLKYPSGHSGDMLMALWFANEGRRNNLYWGTPIEERILTGKNTDAAEMLNEGFIW